jgi:putative ABC transport system substrate-binding protein
MTPKLLETAAISLGIRIQSLPVEGPDSLENAFTAAVRERSQALIVFGDPFLFDKRAAIISFAAAKRLATVHIWTDEVLEGGLLAYGYNLREQYRRVVPYVDKILKGAKPGDLPVEQWDKYQIAINLKTAKALGITVPTRMLLRADRVIE